MADNNRYVDIRELSHRNRKLWVWLIWLSVMIVSAIYCIISIFSFQNVLDVYNAQDNVDNHELWAFLAATLLAPAMVIGFFLFGTFTLAFSTISEAGLTYAYGAMHISTLWMSVLVLQSSVTIHAYKDRMKLWERTGTQDTDDVEDWDGGKTTLAQVAYVFGYGLSIVYLGMYIVLFVFRSAAQRLILDPKIEERRKKEEEEAAAAAAASGQADAPTPEKTQPLNKSSQESHKASADGEYRTDLGDDDAQPKATEEKKDSFRGWFTRKGSKSQDKADDAAAKV